MPFALLSTNKRSGLLAADIPKPVRHVERLSTEKATATFVTVQFEYVKPVGYGIYDVKPEDVESLPVTIAVMSVKLL